MGMYTRLKFNADLVTVKSLAETAGYGHAVGEVPIDADSTNIEALRYMCGLRENAPARTPDHALFSTPRWDIMLHCDSYYHPGVSVCVLELDDIDDTYKLTVNTNLKNYDNEISLFLDWIAPFVEQGVEVQPLGYILYEEGDCSCHLIWQDGARLVTQEATYNA